MSEHDSSGASASTPRVAASETFEALRALFGQLRSALHEAHDPIAAVRIMHAMRALDVSWTVERALPYLENHLLTERGAGVLPETMARAEAVRRWIEARLGEDHVYWARRLGRLAIHDVSASERAELMRMGAPFDWARTGAESWMVRADHRDLLWFMLHVARSVSNES